MKSNYYYSIRFVLIFLIFLGSQWASAGYQVDLLKKLSDGQYALEYTNKEDNEEDDDEEEITLPPIDDEKILKSLLKVKGDVKQGHGFVCNIKGKFFAVANMSTLAGNNEFTLSLLDGTEIPHTGIFNGKGADIAIIAIPEQENFLSVGKSFTDLAKSKSPVTALSKEKDSDEVIGLSTIIQDYKAPSFFVQPRLMAECAGLPIIDPASGELLGAAAISVELPPEGEELKTALPQRDFCVRLEKITKWTPVKWQSFVEQNKRLEQIKVKTIALATFVESRTKKFKDEPAIAEIIERYNKKFEEEGLKEKEYLKELDRCIENIEKIADEDFTYFNRASKCDYIRHLLAIEKRYHNSMVEHLTYAKKIMTGDIRRKTAKKDF